MDYISYAKENGFKYVIVMKDLEDKSEYPVYFKDIVARERHLNNIISESKTAVVHVINVDSVNSK